MTLADCHQFQTESPEHVAALVKLYAELDIPVESPYAFFGHLTARPDAWFVEVSNVGLVYLTNIVLHFCADINAVFWDKRFGRDRREIVQSVACSGFELFDLKRIQARVPSANIAFRTQLERAGFKHEGVLRNGWIDPRGVSDMCVLGMIREEKPECPLLPIATSSAATI